MKPIIDHIQITVKDLARSERFYDQIMPILGFDLENKSKGTLEAHAFEVIEYVHPSLTIGINSPRESVKNDPVHRRRPGSLHHLAFRTKSIDEVDELYPLIRKIGAEIVDPPKYYPSHGDQYYALFFKDPDGIKFEIMHEEKA
ncbi:MAG: catechol 2,3-dioxygenase-like lactoylglutathione lyase family enzyme [Psychroserpens sp.]|jgi:catechol 2,3-dioxygenase-like lactoylglutathione lyase family enzyme